MSMEKRYKVHITRFALEQIDEIKQYIVNELFAPQAAKELLLSIKETIASLEVLPLRNPFVDEEKWRKQGIHRTVVKNFLVYYWVDEEKSVVYITAVVYGKREQLRQLEEMDME